MGGGVLTSTPPAPAPITPPSRVYVGRLMQKEDPSTRQARQLRGKMGGWGKFGGAVWGGCDQADGLVIKAPDGVRVLAGVTG